MRRLTGKIAQSLRQRKLRRLTAADARPQDFYIVEFPKSGITWLQTLLANLLIEKEGHRWRVTYFNIPSLIPDIHMCRGGRIGDTVFPSIPFRMIKSHSELNPFYTNCLYLVRHPVSVMNSYYRYLSMHDNADMSPEEFLDSSRFGLPAWRRHVNGWLSPRNTSTRFYIIRYEDLIADTLAEVGQLADVLGLEAEPESIRRAVTLSSVESMAESEARYSARDPRYDMEFVRSARDGLDPQYSELITSRCQRELEILGY